MKYTLEEIRHYCIGMECEFQDQTIDDNGRGIIINVRERGYLYPIEIEFGKEFSTVLCPDEIQKIPMFDAIRRKRLWLLVK